MVPEGTISADSPLETGWDNTGENLGAGVGSDGTPNGILTGITIVAEDVTNANFGINKAPETDDQAATLPTQPTSNQFVVLDGTQTSGVGLPTGLDSESQPASGTLAEKSVSITSLPVNGELWYDGSQITLGADGTNPPSPTNPFMITNFDPTKLEAKLTGSGYTSMSFDFAYVDAAGTPDPTPATYTLSWTAPLPVTLIRFTAAREGLTSVLSWATTAESNSEAFSIEQRTKTSEWGIVGIVKAKGESKRLVEYSFVDASPQNGENLYRLKMIDLDGTFAYSRINSVSFDFAPKLTLYLNPANNQIKVKLGGSSDWEQVSQIKLYDLTGRLVYAPQKMIDGEIDVKGIPAGAYVVIIIYKNGTIHNAKIQIVK